MITAAESKLIRKLKSRKQRDREGAFLVEGVRLAEELFASALEVGLVVTSPTLERTPRGRKLLRSVEAGDQQHRSVSDAELAVLADTDTPQGVLAVARTPQLRLADFEPAENCALLVLDGLSDPGNLGTLLRTAHGLGVAWAVALPGTVDAWSPKVVRAAAGSLFAFPVSHEPWSEVATWLREREFTILCADASGGPARTADSFGPRIALVLGSEPAGPSAQVLRDCDRRIAIELRAGVESLNVAIAGALLLDRLIGR